MLSPLKLFATKLAVFTTVLAYLAIDLLLWQGPVWGFIQKEKEQQAQVAPDTVARVYGQEISEAQRDRQALALAWMRGEPQKAEAYKQRAINSLIAQEILRTRVRYNDKNLPRTEVAALNELVRLGARIGRKQRGQADGLEHRLTLAGSSSPQFLKQIEERLRECALLERAIAPTLEVSEAELQSYYESVKAQMTIPASREVTHIFLTKNNWGDEKGKARAEEILKQLTEGAKFADLAQKYSEDLASKKRGGQLGFVYQDARITLKELPLFGESALAANEYHIVQSRWGWHLLKAGPIKQARLPNLEESRATLLSALQSAKREFAVKKYFDESLKEVFHHKHAQIYAK